MIITNSICNYEALNSNVKINKILVRIEYIDENILSKKIIVRTLS